jgi:microcystin-dependent protein
MDELSVTKLNSKIFEQIWNSSDLNADRITSELNKVFIYNQSATLQHRDGSRYFNVNRQKLQKSASSVGVGFWSKIAATLLEVITVSGAFGVNVNVDKATEVIEAEQYEEYASVSDTQINQHLSQHGVHLEWSGEKLVPKSFDVYKITELTDRIQIGIIAKQLIADKNQSAIIRVISTINTPHTEGPTSPAHRLILSGEIRIYTGLGEPPAPWLLCNGSAISRIEYQRLFTIIGERYGSGDGVYTFNLPDFRGRVPLGVDESRLRVDRANEMGMSGGKSSHNLTVDQLPSHTHSHSSLHLQSSGGHTHSVYDPGHDHGGHTGSADWGAGTMNYRGSPGAGRSVETSHTHTIPRGTTSIAINAAGDHTHQLLGQISTTGSGQAFSLLPPYQTVTYIIYSD